jgi:hypothetical protein
MGFHKTTTVELQAENGTNITNLISLPRFYSPGLWEAGIEDRMVENRSRGIEDSES